MVTIAHEQRSPDGRQPHDPPTSAFLVGYDGSPDAGLAVNWAAAAASAHGRDLRVLVVAEPDDMVLTPDWPPSWLADIERQARGAVATAAPGSRSDPDRVVEHQVGPAVAVLAAESAHASLLVLGSRGHGMVRQALLGSVSTSLARRAHCPVVVVRPESHPGSGRVVVGHDGSESSRRALDFACRHALATGQRVTVLRAHHLPAVVPVDKHGDVPPSLSRTLQDEERALSAVADEARARWPGLTIETDLFPVDAGTALVAASERASLVVLGVRSEHPLAEAVVGTISRRVLHEATCPVAVVH
jgi:nucleotide-binding universal stress UspA family protein